MSQEIADVNCKKEPLSFEALWGRYSQCFNCLSEKIAAAGIDISLLHEVVEATQSIERFKARGY